MHAPGLRNGDQSWGVERPHGARGAGDTRVGEFGAELVGGMGCTTRAGMVEAPVAGTMTGNEIERWSGRGNGLEAWK